MRVLVTGASGFAGSLLIPRLHREGHALRAFARDPTRLRIPSPGTSRSCAATLSVREV